MSVLENISAGTRSNPASPSRRPLRVLYSFPHKIGADRICHTAWSQVDGLTHAGAEVCVVPGVLHRPFLSNVKVTPTLAFGKLRISYKLVGTKRACAIHDFIVSQRIKKLVGRIDLIHCWPMGSLRTLKIARQLGIPTFLERPNAHTRYAYEVVQRECEKLGLQLPTDHEHAHKPDWLAIEEEEYRLTDYLLCPSDFVARTFQQYGFPPQKLVRHQYGFDEKTFYAPKEGRQINERFTMLFAGGCAPRKGLHYALQAWLASPASKDGEFLIAGGFVPGYREKLATALSHPSVKILGHRRDVADLMRQSDVFVLPSIEEGSALVTSEARGCGCVLLVSDAAGAICEHGMNSFVHAARDATMLASQLTLLHQDKTLLARFRNRSLSSAGTLSWAAAGRVLLQSFNHSLSHA